MRNIFVLFFVVICFLLACSGRGVKEIDDGSSAYGEATYNVIHIAYLPTLDALPYFVAKQRGLFEAEGLDVWLVPFAAQMDIDTALVGGSVDGAFTDIIRVAQLQKKEGLKLDILTSTEAQWTLVSNKVARLNKLEQMGDKMVAMTRFSATDYFTDQVFKGVKKAAPHFKVQINDVELRLRMLQNNEMDALWLPEPYATRALLMGHKVLVESQKYTKKLGVLALRQAFIDKKKNEKTADRLTKVYSMACDSINKYGIVAYADELQMYCDIDSAVINNLPDIEYAHAKKPSTELVEEARKYIGE